MLATTDSPSARPSVHPLSERANVDACLAASGGFKREERADASEEVGYWIEEERREGGRKRIRLKGWERRKDGAMDGGMDSAWRDRAS